MDFKDVGDKFPAVRGIIGNVTKSQLDYYVEVTGMKISRLVGIAIYNELKKEVPFEWPCEFPEDEVIEYAYIEQAGKILAFFKKQFKAVPIDFLMLIRDDIGVPDHYEFLMGLKDCVEKRMVSRIIQKEDSKFYKKGTILYGLKANLKPEVKKVRRKASKYEMYQKLKKEFKDV